MEFALIFLESLKELVYPPRWVVVFSVPGLPVLVLGSALGLLLVPWEGPSSSLALGPSLLDLGAPLSTSVVDLFHLPCLKLGFRNRVFINRWRYPMDRRGESDFPWWSLAWRARQPGYRS